MEGLWVAVAVEASEPGAEEDHIVGAEDEVEEVAEAVAAAALQVLGPGTVVEDPEVRRVVEELPVAAAAGVVAAYRRS